METRELLQLLELLKRSHERVNTWKIIGWITPDQYDALFYLLFDMRQLYYAVDDKYSLNPRTAEVIK